MRVQKSETSRRWSPPPTHGNRNPTTETKNPAAVSDHVPIFAERIRMRIGSAKKMIPTIAG